MPSRAARIRSPVYERLFDLHMKDVNPNATGTGYDSNIELQTQVQILQSRALLDRVSRKLLSRGKRYAGGSDRFAGWRNVLHLTGNSQSQNEAAIHAATRNLPRFEKSDNLKTYQKVPL